MLEFIESIMDMGESIWFIDSGESIVVKIKRINMEIMVSGRLSVNVWLGISATKYANITSIPPT